MKKILLMILAFSFICITSFAGVGYIYGTLQEETQNDGSIYYYVYLDGYQDSNSFQSLIFAAYPTNGGNGIWYDNKSWTLDSNPCGQHVSVNPDNLPSSTNFTVGQSYEFSYETDANGLPVCTEYDNSAKDWLVVDLQSVDNSLLSVPGESLHTSIAYRYND